MWKDELIQILTKWIEQIYKNDYELVKSHTAERSLVSLLACYIRSDIKKLGYHVDVEYNREWENRDSKRNYYNDPTTADLIIHTRQNKFEWNILYLEAKTSFNIWDSNYLNDIKTIKYFIKKFNYEYWIFIVFKLDTVYYELYVQDKDEPIVKDKFQI